MEVEAQETPQVISRQFADNYTLLEALTVRIQGIRPSVAVTVARGSSDHAATFLKYLLETRAGLITSSAAPSVLTLYQKQLPQKNSLVLGISQSGVTPDVAEVIWAARKAGAITVGFVNDTDSPLADAAEYIVPLGAGVEKSIAATKTYIATLAAFIQFVGIFTGDQVLLNAISELPELLQQATQKDWSTAMTAYQGCKTTLVIGRGFGYPIAQEAALKFKEIAKIHAEAFSGAELLHGPLALVEKEFPLFLFAQQDETFSGMQAVAKKMKMIGAKVLLASPMLHESEKDLLDMSSILLPLPHGIHPVCDTLVMIQAFYCMIAKLSVTRGFNPDAPTHLTKVTKTW